MDETVSDGSTLTLEKLQEALELIEPIETVREQFFKRFYPDIKNINDWYIAIPKTDDPNILKFIEENDWVHMDVYAPHMIAIELGGIIRSWYD